MAVAIFGCGGIGRALALRLSAAGKVVHLLARDQAKLQAVKDSASAGAIHIHAVDVTNNDALEAACKTVAGAGPLAGSAFAIGSIPLKPLRSTTAADMASTFALNVTAPFTVIKALSPSLAAGSEAGAVVLFSSIAARVGFPNHVAIGTAKAAVEGLTVAAAAELAPKVRVNCIAPSLTDTPLAGRFLSNPTTKTALGSAHPIPRVGSPDEMAALAEFLLDDSRSGFITGQVFGVDGGRSSLRLK